MVAPASSPVSRSTPRTASAKWRLPKTADKRSREA
jgi:hypothetical protein